jgi:hypothetical protein
MSSSEPPPSSEPPVSEPPLSDQEPQASADEDREAILARRAFFVAGAIASIGLAGCDVHPQPCLSATAHPTDGGVAPEAADASALPDAVDATAPPADPTVRDAGAAEGGVADAGKLDAGKPDAGAADAGKPVPQPCLRMLPPQKPPPQPCLSVVAPEQKK